MTAPPLPAAVLWDMDGTLVDTEPYWFDAETRLVTRFGGTWTHEQAKTLVGSGLQDGARVLQRHGVAMEVDEIIAWQTAHVVEHLQDDLPWRPGALELLAAVRAAGIPTALVTMSFRGMALAVAGAMPAGSLDLVIAGDDVTRAKPDPEPYLLAAERLGVDVRDCVAVEDSPPGLASAVASGAAAIGVPHMVPLPEGARWRLWDTLVGRTVGDLAAVAQELKALAA